MNFIFELIIQIIGEGLVSLTKYPGAYVLWSISKLRGSKKSFKKYAEDNNFISYVLGVSMLICLIWLIAEMSQ